MLEQVNRGAGHSFGNLERHWQGLLEKDPTTHISVDIRPHYSGSKTVLSEIEVRYRVDDGPARREVFFND